MPMEEEPVVGAIYEDPDGLAFEILSFDEDDGTIEVQYEDGEVGEIDIDAWYEMELKQLRSADSEDSDEDEEEEIAPEKADKRAPVKDDDDDDLDDCEEDDNDDDYNS
jgi:hypothetical protein